MGFTCDAEVLAMVLEKYLDKLIIRTEADHGRLVQDKDMEQEYGTVWGAIWNKVELAQNRAEEAIFTNLKRKVSKIDSSTKNRVRNTGFHHLN